MELRVHKDLNREPLVLEKEIYINFFCEIIEKFNKTMDINKEIIFSFSDIKKILKIKNTNIFDEFLLDFVRKSTRIFEIPEEKGVKIVGSIFSIKIDTPRETVGVMVNGYFKKFVFSKLDIETMKKFKKGSINRVTDIDREYHKENKEKFENLMLICKDDILEIKGKYNKILYKILIQFKATGKFWMKWEDFRNVLEVPKSYKACNIDQKILTKGKEELLKVGLEITKITKIKKGRSIDMIEIFFNIDNGKLNKNKNKKIIEKAKSKNFVLDLKSELARIIMKNNRLNLMKNLEKLNTLEELKKFKIEYNL